VALALTGAIAVSSVAGARDALVHWAESKTTFDDFWGEDTLLARAAARWDAYGTVDLDPDLGENPLTIAGVRRYRLDPDRQPVAGSGERAAREFRIVAPDVAGRPDERLVERVADAWGREWGWVYGRLR
jgi:hypothetical protein